MDLKEKGVLDVLDEGNYIVIPELLVQHTASNNFYEIKNPSILLKNCNKFKCLFGGQ